MLAMPATLSGFNGLAIVFALLALALVAHRIITGLSMLRLYRTH